MIKIRDLTEHDYPAVRTIFQQGIDMGDATFQNQTTDWKYWNTSKQDCCRLVAEEQSEIIGWAALSAVSGLSVYKGVAEVSLYIADQAQGKGVGFSLLSELINCSEQQGFWTLQSGIFPENIASLALHKKTGFKELGLRQKMGSMSDGTWRDVVFMERRSSIVGI